MTGDWVVVFLLDVRSVLFERMPFAIGAFEISVAPEPFDVIETALRDSAEAWNLSFGYDRHRIRQVIEGPATAEEALRIGWLRAKEAIAVLAMSTIHDLRIEVREAGCAVNIESGDVFPRVPGTTNDGILRISDEVALHPFSTLAELLTDPESYGELGHALRRTAHWTSLAKRSDDEAERLILYWIAGETIAKASEDDDIPARFLTAMGLAVPRGISALPKEVEARLRLARKSLQPAFGKFRSHRNSIAHDGFRELDLVGVLSAQDRRLLTLAIPHAVRSVQLLAVDGLATGIRTKRHLWKNVSDIGRYARPPTPAEEGLASLRAVGLPF